MITDDRVGLGYERGMLKSPSIIMDLSISSYNSVNLGYIFLKTILLANSEISS